MVYMLYVYLAALSWYCGIYVVCVPSCSELDHLKLVYLRFCMWVPEAAAGKITRKIEKHKHVCRFSLLIYAIYSIYINIRKIF